MKNGFEKRVSLERAFRLGVGPKTSTQAGAWLINSGNGGSGGGGGSSSYQAGPAGNNTGTFGGTYVRKLEDKVKEYPDIWDFEIASGRFPNPDRIDLTNATIATTSTDIELIDESGAYAFTSRDLNKPVTIAGGTQPYNGGVRTNWYGFIDALHATNPNACYLRGDAHPEDGRGYIVQFGTDNGLAFINLFQNTYNPHVPYGNWYKTGSCIWYPGQHVTADGGYTSITQGSDAWAFNFEPNMVDNQYVTDYQGLGLQMSMDSLTLWAFRGIKTGARYVDGPSPLKAIGTFGSSAGLQTITVNSIQLGTVDGSLVGQYFASGDAFYGYGALQGWIIHVAGTGVGAVLTLNTAFASNATQPFEVGTKGSIIQSNPTYTQIFNSVTINGYFEQITDPNRNNPNWLVDGIYAPLRTYDEVDAVNGTGVLTTNALPLKFLKCDFLKSGISARIEGSIEVTFDNCWFLVGGRFIDAIVPLDVYFRGTSAEMFINFCKVTSFTEQAPLNAPHYGGIHVEVHEWENSCHHPQIICGDNLTLYTTNMGVITNPAIKNLGYVYIDTAGNLSNPAGFLNDSVNGGTFTDGGTGYQGTFSYASPTTGYVTPPPPTALTCLPWNIVLHQEQAAIQILAKFGGCRIHSSGINNNGAELQEVAVNLDYVNLFIANTLVSIVDSVGFVCKTPFSVTKIHPEPYLAKATNSPRSLGGIQWDNSQGLCFGDCSAVSGGTNITIETTGAPKFNYTSGEMSSIYNGSKIEFVFETLSFYAYIVSVSGQGNGAVVTLDRPWPYATASPVQYNVLSNVGWVQEAGNDFYTVNRDYQQAVATFEFDILSPTHRHFNLILSGVKRSGPTQVCSLATPGVAGSFTIRLAAAPTHPPVLNEYVLIGASTDPGYDIEFGKVMTYNAGSFTLTLDRPLVYSGALEVTLGPKPKINSAYLFDANGVQFFVGGTGGDLTGLADNSDVLGFTDAFRLNTDDQNLLGPTPANVGPGSRIIVDLECQPLELFEVRLDPVVNIPEIYWDVELQALVVQSDDPAYFSTKVGSGYQTYMASLTGYNGVRLQTTNQGDTVVLEAGNFPFGGSGMNIGTDGLISGALGYSPSLHGARLHLPDLGLNFTLDSSSGATLATPPPTTAITNANWNVFPLPQISPGEYPYGAVTAQVGWFQGFVVTPKLICPSIDATSLKGVNLGGTMASPSPGETMILSAAGNWETGVVPRLDAENAWSALQHFAAGIDVTNGNFSGVVTAATVNTGNLVTRKTGFPATPAFISGPGSGTYNAAQITALINAVNELASCVQSLISAQNS